MRTNKDLLWILLYFGLSLATTSLGSKNDIPGNAVVMLIHSMVISFPFGLVWAGVFILIKNFLPVVAAELIFYVGVILSAYLVWGLLYPKFFKGRNGRAKILILLCLFNLLTFPLLLLTKFLFLAFI